MSYTVSEIVKSVIGLDDNNKPNAAISFNLSSINKENGLFEDKTEVHACNAEVKIKKINGFVTVDLVFVNKYASEFHRLWSALEVYGESATNYDDFEEVVPVNGVLTILPISLEGKAFISAVNPIYWSLLPSTPADEINTIRLLFQDFNFLFLEGKEFDVVALRESIEQEIRKEEDRAEQIANRIDEEEEYQEFRNAKIEALRKTPNFEETPLQRKMRKEAEKTANDKQNNE